MLSVIVPIYNVETYLTEALESLEKQELQDVEFLLIIDGATDKSEEICQSFAQRDLRFQVIVKENEGYGKTCNLGITIAQGDYIAIFEPDDTVSAGMYRVLYALAKQHHVDIVRSNFIYHQGSSLESSNLFIPSIVNPSNPSSYHKGIKPLDQTLFYGVSLPTQLCFDPYFLFSKHPSIWANIYKKEFLTENKLEFMTTPGASFQDFAFHIETFSFAKHILFVNEAFYFYRVHPFNSSSIGRKLFIHLDIMSYLLQTKQLLKFVPPNTKSRYFKAFMHQYIWWLNKNKSIIFTWDYSAKMAAWSKTHAWVTDPTFSIPERKLVESYKLDSHFTQFFYTVYTMFVLLGPEHKKLRKIGLRLLRTAEFVLSNIGILKRIKLLPFKPQKP